MKFKRNNIIASAAIVFILYLSIYIGISITNNTGIFNTALSSNGELESGNNQEPQKIISPGTTVYHEMLAADQAKGKDILPVSIDTGECGDNLYTLNDNCIHTPGAGVVNAELNEINTLKDVLYGNYDAAEKVAAANKLGKYRTIAAYEALLNAPYEQDSEVRLEVIRQLSNLLPQLINEYENGVRYVFELAMTDIDESITLLASDALNEYDHIWSKREW